MNDAISAFGISFAVVADCIAAIDRETGTGEWVTTLVHFGDANGGREEFIDERDLADATNRDLDLLIAAWVIALGCTGFTDRVLSHRSHDFDDAVGVILIAVAVVTDFRSAGERETSAR